MGGQGTPKGPVMGGTWEENGYETSSHNGAPKIYSPWNKWFPYEPVPFSPRLGPYKVNVRGGELYQWCSCGESISQPWCDDVGCKGTKFNPIAYVPRHTGPVLLCGSKHSPGRPLFNGTCWIVWADVNTVPAAGLCFFACFFFGIFSTWMAHP